MAFVERYANFDLATGDDNGTSEANAWRTLSSMLSGCAAGDRVNIKRQSSAFGPITTNTTFGPGTAATATNPISFRGYATTIGDGGLWDATITSAGTVTITYAAYATYEGLRFIGTGAVNIIAHNGTASSRFRRCTFDIVGDNTGGASGNIGISNIDKCLLILGTGRLGLTGTNSAVANVLDSYIIRKKTTSANGHILNNDAFGRASLIKGCTFVGNEVAENGIFLDRANSMHGSSIIGNRFFGFTNAIEIDEEPTGDTRILNISSNVFSTMTGRAIKRTNTYSGQLMIHDNLFHSCTSGFTDYSNFASDDSNVSLSANPFTNVATGDLSFNDTAGGGAVCRSRGFRMQDAYDWPDMEYLATPSGGGGGGFYVSQSARMLR